MSDETDEIPALVTIELRAIPLPEALGNERAVLVGVHVHAAVPGITGHDVADALRTLAAGIGDRLQEHWLADLAERN